MDTFWYIDPDYGLDGVWDNSLASEPPIYNDDFTQMTVRLREGHLLERRGRVHRRRRGVHRRDPHEHRRAGAQCGLPAQRRERRGTRSLYRRLQPQAPNSRFHALFTVRWNAAWMMPKHVFEGQNPLEFNFNPPVSLGSYTLHSYDPNGGWFTWEKREDWERTSLARHGEPGPQYVTYLDPGRPIAGSSRR
jgi:peptide/nickel transport system substrate-binding protein